MKSNRRIMKDRRALLSEFSAFVKVTKSLNILDGHSSQEIDVLELIHKAFQTVTRAVRFHDTWEAHMQSLAAQSNQESVPPTPPADQDAFSNLVANSTAHRTDAENATTGDHTCGLVVRTLAVILQGLCPNRVLLL